MMKTKDNKMMMIMRIKMMMKLNKKQTTISKPKHEKRMIKSKKTTFRKTSKNL